jgi:type IV secretory pathway protease TraF
VKFSQRCEVAALSGDRVTIGVQGVQVNGVLLKNSAPRPADEAGRPLRAYELSDYALRSEEVLLMSDYNPASFDGRYFGPLPKTNGRRPSLLRQQWRIQL